MIRFLPESPRWLLAKGRLEEASKILETLARVNNKELPDTFRQKLKVSIVFILLKEIYVTIKISVDLRDLFLC